MEVHSAQKILEKALAVDLAHIDKFPHLMRGDLQGLNAGQRFSCFSTSVSIAYLILATRQDVNLAQTHLDRAREVQNHRKLRPIENECGTYGPSLLEEMWLNVLLCRWSQASEIAVDVLRKSEPIFSKCGFLNADVWAFAVLQDRVRTVERAEEWESTCASKQKLDASMISALKLMQSPSSVQIVQRAVERASEDYRRKRRLSASERGKASSYCLNPSLMALVSLAFREGYVVHVDDDMCPALIMEQFHAS